MWKAPFTTVAMATCTRNSAAYQRCPVSTSTRFPCFQTPKRPQKAQVSGYLTKVLVPKMFLNVSQRDYIKHCLKSNLLSSFNIFSKQHFKPKFRNILIFYYNPTTINASRCIWSLGSIYEPQEPPRHPRHI